MRYIIIFYVVSGGLQKFNKNLGANVINEAKRKGEGFLRYNTIKIDFKEINGHIFIPVIVVGEYGSYETIMMLDTGASMTVISLELAQETGHEDLNEISRRTFSAVKGLISCPIIQREIIVGDIYKNKRLLLIWKMTPIYLIWTFLNQGNI